MLPTPFDNQANNIGKKFAYIWTSFFDVLLSVPMVMEINHKPLRSLNSLEPFRSYYILLKEFCYYVVTRPLLKSINWSNFKLFSLYPDLLVKNTNKGMGSYIFCFLIYEYDLLLSSCSILSRLYSSNAFPSLKISDIATAITQISSGIC